MKVNRQPILAQTTDEFLRIAFARQKNLRKGFGVQKLAQELGFRSPAAVSMILHGKRKLKVDAIESVARSLGLRGKEKRILSILVRLDSTKRKSEQFRLKEKLVELRGGSEGETLKIQQYRFLSEWYYPAIFMMVANRSFKENHTWIANKLGRGVTISQVRKAIQDLLSMGMIKREGAQLVQSASTFTTPDDVKAAAISDFHQKMLELAFESLELPLEEREINSLTVSIPRNQLPVFKRKIRKFRKEMNQMFENQSEESEVYQMNIQLFPLTGHEQRKGE